MTAHGIAIAPSILSADCARLGDQVAEAEAAGVERIHVDVRGPGRYIASALAELRRSIDGVREAHARRV